ncbi:unnamed protein product [Triticum turgidum subsp. durum]|uniref:BHLH domain-containing protein n=1 Tax=Triticum turgidum subsp. durum TaxID=4567 RepID=A0A9R1B1Z0_TRITD|nr:unnamed protein product [Triticum turgidum subsp. durum]
MAHCGGGQAASVESHFQGLLDDDDKYRALCGAFGYVQQQEWPDLSGACYSAFGAPPPPGAATQATSNGAGNSFTCSGSASSGGGSAKRKPDAYVDAKVRRERISERMRYLQELVPGCDKVTGKAGMLDEIINYVQSLQKQVEVNGAAAWDIASQHLFSGFDAQFQSVQTDRRLKNLITEL